MHLQNYFFPVKSRASSCLTVTEATPVDNAPEFKSGYSSIDIIIAYRQTIRPSQSIWRSNVWRRCSISSQSPLSVISNSCSFSLSYSTLNRKEIIPRLSVIIISMLKTSSTCTFYVPEYIVAFLLHN